MRIVCLLAAGIALAFDASSTTAAAMANTTVAAEANRTVRAAAHYSELPLAFEENRGQAEQGVRFVARDGGFRVLLRDDEAVLWFRAGDGAPRRDESHAAAPRERSAALVRMRLEHANAHPEITGLDRLDGVSNYLVGNDPARWQRGVPNYARVRYAGVYPGIDLVYYGNERRLEYDFVVAPGADPRRITLAYTGTQKLSLDRDGNLVVATAAGKLVALKPTVYQDIDGIRRMVDARYRLRGDARVGFTIARYDRTRPLVIDPALAYLSYAGGTGNDVGGAVAVDRSGSAYVVGSTSGDYPVLPGAPQGSYGGDIYDVFVTKLNPAGTARIYSTYLGGSGQDTASAIAVDAAGNAYIAGATRSKNFPVTPGAFQATNHAGLNTDNAFVAKLDPTGSTIVYATYLGGVPATLAQGIAVDAGGNAYVTGFTVGDFPVTPGAYQTTYGGGGDDVFVTKLNATGTALEYSTYVGGNDNDSGSAIAIDPAGNAYVAGSTRSANFPTTPGAYQTVYGGDNRDAVVFKLDASGSSLVYSTYLGGNAQGNDRANGIAIDATGSVYVSGDTPGGFPVTPGAYQTTYGGGPEDAFVAKLDPTGSTLVFATYLGGPGDDYTGGIGVDARGNVYVTGATSGGFPVTAGALQGTYGGGPEDGFVARLNPTGSALLYSTYLGTGGDDYGYGLALDTYFNLYVVGGAGAAGLPTTPGVAQPGYGGGPSDAFIAKFAADADATLNHQGVYWNAPAGSESGWGVFAHHQGDTVFGNWFTFGLDGVSTWMVFAGVARSGLPNVFTGDLYTGTGPPFSAFDPAQVAPVKVGTATLAFSGPDDGTFAYTVNTPAAAKTLVVQAKTITREVFASPVPTCTYDALADPALATNYQGIWWRSPAGSEPGWGLAIAHQGDTLFVAWFTYGADGKATWFVVAAKQAAPGVYTGTLYRATGGPPFNGPFDPAQVHAAVAGAATFSFVDGNHGSFAYTVDNVTQLKAITRQAFVPGATICQ